MVVDAWGLACARRMVTLDTDALLKWNQTKQLLGSNDDLIVTPNVISELRNRIPVTIKDMQRFLVSKGVRAVDTAPGASVPASALRSILDGHRGHRGNAGDGLNIAEASGAGADLFVTCDKRVVKQLVGADGGKVALPRSGGSTIMLRSI